MAEPKPLSDLSRITIAPSQYDELDEQYPHSDAAVAKKWQQKHAQFAAKVPAYTYLVSYPFPSTETHGAVHSSAGPPVAVMHQPTPLQPPGSGLHDAVRSQYAAAAGPASQHPPPQPAYSQHQTESLLRAKAEYRAVGLEWRDHMAKLAALDVRLRAAEAALVNMGVTPEPEDIFGSGQ